MAQDQREAAAAEEVPLLPRRRASRILRWRRIGRRPDRYTPPVSSRFWDNGRHHVRIDGIANNLSFPPPLLSLGQFAGCDRGRGAAGFFRQDALIADGLARW